ncbi:MAG: D-aminoacyl-tRNA deacylase [Promethearchaeia archaeon]
MTTFLIITSKEDIASINIRKNLLNSEDYQFTETEKAWHNYPIYELENIIEQDTEFLEETKVQLGLTDTPLILLDNLELEKSDIDPDILIFASRHRSKSGKPAFLAHTTGNWTEEAEYGGKGKRISFTSALLSKAGYLALIQRSRKSKFKKFSVDLEVTHHGPTELKKPLIFMELGSSEAQWTIEGAGRVVADAIIEAILKYSDFQENSIKVGIGFGGTHYAPQFKKRIKKDDIAFSFICPKYYLEDLNRDLIDQMIAHNKEKVDFFGIDWSGTTSDDKSHLVPLLEDFDIPIRKTKDLK